MTSLGNVLRGEARDGVIFTGSNLINRLGGLLILPLYWSQLTPSDYGVIATVVVIGVFQTVLSSASLDLAVTRFYYEWAPGDRSRNLGAIWVWNWLNTIAVGAVLATAMPLVGPILFPDVAPAPWLILGVLVNLTGNLFVIPASAIRISRMPWVFAAYNLLAFTSSTVLGLWLVLGMGAGLFGLLVSMVLANLIVAAASLVVMLRLSQPTLRAPGLLDAVRFAVPAIPSQLVNAAGATIDRLLLGSLTDLRTLGIYGLALRFAEVVGTLHSSLKMTFGPTMMKGMVEGASRGSEILRSITPYYMIPYFVLALAISLFIGPLLSIIGQAEYFEVAVIVPWLTGIQVLSCLSFYYSNGLFLGKRTELLIVPAVVQVVVLVAASVLLIVPFQTPGIIASRYLSVGSFLVLGLYLSQRVFPIRHHWAIPMALGFVGAAVYALASLEFGSGLVVEMVVSAIALAAFTSFALLLVIRRTRPRDTRRPNDDRRTGGTPADEPPVEFEDAVQRPLVDPLG
jgi:O-antigen/teichoic acid export membrane protein